MNKKLNSIALSILLVTSTFTFLGAFTLFPQQAEAQGVQLRVSAALNPVFQSNFFGPMIVQVVIDDPSAADPGDSTVGLQIKDTTQPRVHLGDGLWYSYFADRDRFLLFLDVITDGLRNNSIATRRATVADATHPAVVNGFAQTLLATSPVRELSVVGGQTYVEINRNTVFPTLPVSIDNAANNQRSVADSNSGVAGVSGDATETCDAECGIESVGVTTDSDWPFIELITFNENSQNSVRAGSASVTLGYKPLAESISAKIDRSASYPVNADVIFGYTDFMENINPVESEQWDWVLDKTTGNTKGLFYHFAGAHTSAYSATNPGGLLGVLFRPNLNFDTRQVLELDSEGITTIKFFEAFRADTGAVAAVVAGAAERTPENSRLVSDALFNGADTIAGTADDLFPVVKMRETNPNTGSWETQAAGIGGRSDVFTGVNDRVANFDYFDIISSVVMTQHDGFATVDREVYDSADRAVFTVTDPDQNLRSRVSEQPSAVRSNTFVKLGNPWPLANNPTFATFFGKNTINEQPGAAGDFDFATTAIGTATNTFNRIQNLAGNQLAPIRNAGMFMAADPDNAAFDTADEIEAELNLGSAFAIADVTGFDLATAAGVAVGDAVVATSFRIDVVNPDTVIVALDLNKNGRIDTNGNALTGEVMHIAVETNVVVTTDIKDATSLDNARSGRTQKAALDFTSIGIGAALDKSSAIIVNTNVNLSDLNKFQEFTATGFQIRANTLSGTIPPVGQAIGLDPLVAGTGIFVTPATGTATDFVSIGPAGLIGPTAPNTDLVDATVYKVMVPEYNMIRADLSELVTGTEAVTDDRVNSVAVQIEAICPAVTCGANGKIVRTIADFTPFEAVDADADFNTGTTQLAGSTKVGTGVFRVADLLAADWDGNGSAWPVDTAEATTLFPNIRLRVTAVTIGNNAGVGDHLNEPTEVIDVTSHAASLDIAGLVNVIPPPNLLSTAAGAISAGTPTFAATRTIDEVTLLSTEHALYRIQVKEQGVNSSIFTGRMDFQTANQLDTTQRALSDVVFSGDPAKAFMPNRFIPPNRLAFAYTDIDIVDVFRPTSASFIFETRDGKLDWDKASYSFGQDAFLTLTDEDLNRRPDATERYDLPIAGFVFFELGKQRVVDNADRILGRGNLLAAGAFLNQIDGTLLETGPNTGTYVAQITMPSAITISSAAGADVIQGTYADDTVTVSATVNQRDLEANYIDVRDKSSIRNEFDDVANIRTTLGDVVLDRAAYPPGALMFVEIHDNDSNTDVDIRETINLNQLVFTAAQAATQGYGVAHVEGDLIAGAGQGTCTTFALFVVANCAGATPSSGVAPLIEINVFKTGVGRLVTLLPAGMLGLPASGTTGIPNGASLAALNDRFGTGITTNANNQILPILDRNNNVVTTALETGPNTGIYEFEVRLPGPAKEARFPVALPAVLTTGTLLVPTIKSNQPIQVTYTDPATAAGDTDDVEELATFLTNTARLRTDKLEYGLGDRVDVILEEPDFNLDSRAIDEIAFSVLDIVTDKFDSEFGANAATSDFGTVVNSITDLRMNQTKFRESNFNSGVYVVAIEELVKALIDRGETARLLYFDRTPSGGGSEIRVQYTFLVVSILPEIVFDKEEYTPFDEVTVSIISPDSNNDQERIETISPLISTSSESLGRKSFPETGPSTGIFEEDFDLTPDKTRFPGDVKAIREDGVTVEFRIDSDTVATKSVFVNFHVGQVMFDKDAFRLNERGVLRVIDPDANKNPNTIDTLSVRFWSTTDRGGLLVTLRETGDRTGIFEEIITFTPDEESSGTRLRVSEGDTVTSKYTDDTLPAPAALNTDNPSFTVEVEELFASALIGSIVPPLERAVASVPELVDQTGAKLTDVSAGSQVLIQSTITNSQTKKQPFAYIVQIKDKNGVTTSLSWVTGELPAKESLAAAQSWIPDASGEYTVEVFVWQSVDNPTALSPVQTTTIAVK